MQHLGHLTALTICCTNHCAASCDVLPVQTHLQVCLSACHAVSIKHLDVCPDVLCALMTCFTPCPDRHAVLLGKGVTCAVLAGVGIFYQEGDDIANVD